MSEHYINTEASDYIPFENPVGRNDRFSYAKVRLNGGLYFRKEAKTPELRDNLRREILWSEYVTRHAWRDNPAGIAAPNILGFDQHGALLFEYIDAPLVSPPNNPTQWVEQLDRYADMLATLDRWSQQADLRWPDSSKLNGLKNVDQAWSRWLGAYACNVPRLEEAKSYIKQQTPHLTMSIQHGDLTPWQIFNRDDEWVIFDGEKAGDHLPRYNDLCYAYGRLYTRFHDGDAARQLLRLFIEKTDADSSALEMQLMPVMLFRTVGMVGDTHNVDAESLKDSLDLYSRCLSGNLDRLLHK